MVSNREKSVFVPGLLELMGYGRIFWNGGGVLSSSIGCVRHRLIEVLKMWNDLWTEDGTLYPPEVELAQHANHGQSENWPVGSGFPHRAGRYYPDDIWVRPRVVGVVDVWMDSDPGM